jgi:hypothetical protein
MLKLLTQDIKDIMSIKKWGNYYWVYFPYIKAKDDFDRRCRWWGCYDTFEECFDIIRQKDEEYNHLVIDKKLLRKIKLNKINRNYEN